MAAIVLTAANVGVPDPGNAEIHDFVAGNANVTVGKWVYMDTTTKKVLLADANGGTILFQCIGVVVSRRGNTVSVLKRGFVEGFTPPASASGTVAFLADAVGEIDTAASATKTVPVGRWMPATDGDLTPLLYVDIPWAALIA